VCFCGDFSLIETVKRFGSSAPMSLPSYSRSCHFMTSCYNFEKVAEDFCCHCILLLVITHSVV